jgi:hypothetical protein
LLQSKTIKASGGVWFLIAVMVVYCFFSQYPWLCALGVGTMMLIIRSTMKRHQPSVLMFWLMYQWIQVTGTILYSDFVGIPAERLFRSDNVTLAILLSYTGIVLQVFVFSQVLKRQKVFSLDELKRSAGEINTRRVIYLYLISAAAYPLLFTFAINYRELTQIIFILARVKLIFVILLVFLLFLKGEKKILILLILATEFVTGFLTYFSTFKDVFIIALVCYLSFVRQIKFSTIMKLTPVMGALFVLLVFWSAVKDQYRMFVNQGTRVQQVQVESDEAFGKLVELGQGFDADYFEMGLRRLLFRAQYIMFFSKVMDRVPELQEHENGKIMIESLRFVIVPRALDPEKGIHDASLKTSKYTGLRIAGINKGTSMAIGYFGDSYIDFGPVGMMIPIMMLALLMGWLYRYLLNWKLNTILVYSIVTSVMLNIGYFESDIVILLGMLKNNWLVSVLFYFTLYRWINKYIRHRYNTGLVPPRPAPQPI